jgi:hypothetical protein
LAGGDAPLARRLRGGVSGSKWLWLILGLGRRLGNIIRQVVQDIIGVLTPVIDAIGVGMVLLGLLIGLGLRQEFLGFRLIIGGALALLTTHIIIPTILALT